MPSSWTCKRTAPNPYDEASADTMTLFVACVAGAIFCWALLRRMTWLCSAFATRLLLLARGTSSFSWVSWFRESTFVFWNFPVMYFDMSAALELF